MNSRDVKPISDSLRPTRGNGGREEIEEERPKKKTEKKTQIAVRFTSSRLSAAKENRSEQTLASPRFMYTNAGS